MPITPYGCEIASLSWPTLNYEVLMNTNKKKQTRMNNTMLTDPDFLSPTELAERMGKAV